MVASTAVAQAMDLQLHMVTSTAVAPQAMGLPQAMAKQVLMEEVNQAMVAQAIKIKDTADQVKDMVDQATKVKDTADQVMVKDTVEDMDRMEIIVI